MKTVLCSMKGGLFAAARPVWLYNSNLQAAIVHHIHLGQAPLVFAQYQKRFTCYPAVLSDLHDIYIISRS